jgi:hypothetical protein
MEFVMCSALKWDLTPVTPYEIMKYVLLYSAADGRTLAHLLTHAEIFVGSALCEYAMMKYSQRAIALVAVLQAHKAAKHCPDQWLEAIKEAGLHPMTDKEVHACCYAMEHVFDATGIGIPPRPITITTTSTMSPLPLPRRRRRSATTTTRTGHISPTSVAACFSPETRKAQQAAVAQHQRQAQMQIQRERMHHQHQMQALRLRQNGEKQQLQQQHFMMLQQLEIQLAAEGAVDIHTQRQHERQQVQQLQVQHQQQQQHLHTLEHQHLKRQHQNEMSHMQQEQQLTQAIALVLPEGVGEKQPAVCKRALPRPKMQASVLPQGAAEKLPAVATDSALAVDL